MSGLFANQQQKGYHSQERGNNGGEGAGVVVCRGSVKKQTVSRLIILT